MCPKISQIYQNNVNWPWNIFLLLTENTVTELIQKTTPESKLAFTLSADVFHISDTKS